MTTELVGAHQPLAQAGNEIPVALRQVMEQAIDCLDDHAPLREAGDSAERVQARFELEWNADAELRVILDLLTLTGSGWRAAHATTFTDALVGHRTGEVQMERQAMRPMR